MTKYFSIPSDTDIFAKTYLNSKNKLKNLGVISSPLSPSAYILIKAYLFILEKYRFVDGETQHRYYVIPVVVPNALFIISYCSLLQS